MTIKPPESQRLRWPAEWEPHAGTAFTWPHNRATWHQGLERPQAALIDVIRLLARDEVVHLHFPDVETRDRALARIDSDNVIGHHVASNDAWCRDHGAIIVRQPDGKRVALDFGFNAWGGKYPPWDADARIAARMADYLAIDHQTVPVILEGGAIDGNGQGLIMTTASCVLNPNRNTHVDRNTIETLFGKLLGARHVFWLEGEIPGDDTDGHIDNLARFVGPSRALVVSPDRAVTDVERSLAANAKRLEQQASRAGVALQVDTLPMPETFMRETGLPASYANFCLGERSVMMPVYADDADDRACAVVADCFPDRELHPIDCRDLIVGLGALHCLSQQIPAA